MLFIYFGAILRNMTFATTLMQQTSSSRWLRMLLAMVLVVATWHTALHDIDITGDSDSDEQCEVCRLKHSPVDELSVITEPVPFFLLSLILVLPAFKRSTQTNRYTPCARAPPLF